MVGEIIDRIFTYGTPAFLLVKDLLGKAAKNPEIQKVATEQLLKVAKGGRGRVDETFFIVSLITLSGVSKENKELFLDKHYEMLHPDLSGKNPDVISELRWKEKLAKGLIFLIAEDRTAVDEKPSKRFQYAREIWYAIFLDIDRLPDDNAKLKVLEQRILHFGKNHQERITLPEAIERLREIYNSCDPAVQASGQAVGNSIFFVSNLINRQYDERIQRAEERARRRKNNRLNWLNPKLFLQWFSDLR